MFAAVQYLGRRGQSVDPSSQGWEGDYYLSFSHHFKAWARREQLSFPLTPSLNPDCLIGRGDSEGYLVAKATLLKKGDGLV